MLPSEASAKFLQQKKTIPDAQTVNKFQFFGMSDENETCVFWGHKMCRFGTTDIDLTKSG